MLSWLKASLIYWVRRDYLLVNGAIAIFIKNVEHFSDALNLLFS